MIQLSIYMAKSLLFGQRTLLKIFYQQKKNLKKLKANRKIVEIVEIVKIVETVEMLLKIKN